MFGKKINRESTPTEQKLESSLSGEAKQAYAADNHARANADMPVPEGWHKTNYGVHSWGENH